jgi:hypothetical protein
MISHSSSRNKPKVMLVTNQLQAYPIGGREQLCKLNYEALSAIFELHLVLFELPLNRITGIGSILGALRGNIDGLTDQTISLAIQVAQREKIVKVFIDGSNLGEMARVLKQQLPSIEITTFFHNVESRFFLGALRKTWALRKVAVLLVNYMAEKKSVRYSDKIICLSERDRSLLKKLYGRYATHISPIALKDKLPKEYEIARDISREKYALFVGGAFYANLFGIKWFVKNVAPRIDFKICIVGKGFEAFKDSLEITDNVQVVGPVENLANWYRDAHFVIAPIFDGSGMKTKVAEAFMYGKKVVGSPEAFSGYEDIKERAGWECVTVDEFVSAIQYAKEMYINTFDPSLRIVYENTYSFNAAKTRLEKILCE